MTEFVVVCIILMKSGISVFKINNINNKLHELYL